ncbi:MAG: lipid-A-disaccharide synthase, partial [Acidobacteria bacterium]|nr:lipid-A-disaccharide synthase [Acidobacteriota bacterium]
MGLHKRPTLAVLPRMTKPNILISAGDPSGEMYAARLARALQKRSAVRLYGLGGQKMREAGVELVAENQAIAIVGITEVFGKAPTVWRLIRQLAEEAGHRRTKLAILVDSPGFNLRLARHLKAQGVPVVYFISPHVWAWKKWRIQPIRKRVTKMLCIFP